MDSLKFIETMSVADFKAKMGVGKIDVKQNPNTGKCFFVYGCETGAVSERFLKGDITKPVISQVCSPETGDMFYQLCDIQVAYLTWAIGLVSDCPFYFSDCKTINSFL